MPGARIATSNALETNCKVATWLGVACPSDRYGLVELYCAIQVGGLNSKRPANETGVGSDSNDLATVLAGQLPFWRSASSSPVFCCSSSEGAARRVVTFGNGISKLVSNL